MYRKSMANSRYSSIEREGVNAVESVFIKFGWIFREQPIVDVGIDAQVEVCENGKPSGQLIALQIKSGESWFQEKSDTGFIYRGSVAHLEYWKKHSLPVIIVFYSPASKQIYWQVVQEKYIKATGKGWKIVLPFTQKLNESAIPQLLNLSSAFIVEAMLPSVPYCIHMQEIIRHLAERHKIDLKKKWCLVTAESRELLTPKY